MARRGSITGVAAFVLSKRGVNSGEEKNEKTIGRHVRCVGGGLAHPSPVLRTNKRASLDRFFPPLGALGDVMTISIR